MMTDSPLKPLAQLAEQMSQLDSARLAVLVSLLPAEAAFAVQLGADVALARAEQRLDDRLRVDYSGDSRWHRVNLLAEIDELDTYRYPPNGDRAEWVAYGPAGRPAVRAAGVAA